MEGLTEVEWLARLVIFQPGADITIAQAARFGFYPPGGEALRRRPRPQLGVTPGFNLVAGLLPLALSGIAQLGDKAAFLVAHEGAGDLAHHLGAGVIAVSQIIARGGQQPNVAFSQQCNAQLLRDRVAGKSAGVLNDDGANAVAFDAQQARAGEVSTSPAEPGSAPCAGESFYPRACPWRCFHAVDPAPTLFGFRPAFILAVSALQMLVPLPIRVF
jgi:hypothetical protein